MNQKQRQEYKRYEEENFVPFHQKLAVLENACKEGKLELVSVYEGTQLVGLLPYYIKQKLAYKYICHPPMIKWMGPLLASNCSDRKKVINELLSKIPNVAYFEQNFYYNIAAQDLPESWKENFIEQYSYRIEGIQDLETIFKKIYPDYRNNKLKKAESQLQISLEGTVEEFLSVHHQSFIRQGIQYPVKTELLKSHILNLLERKMATLLFARDKEMNTHSVALLVWDEKTAYFHMAGDDISLRKSGSGIFLTWQAIKYASEHLGLNEFDFEGSMLENVERVRKRFGGIKNHYGKIKRYNSASFKLLQNLKK